MVGLVAHGKNRMLFNFLPEYFAGTMVLRNNKSTSLFPIKIIFCLFKKSPGNRENEEKCFVTVII